LSGSALAVTFSGTEMTPLLTSGTGTAGMPSLSLLAYWKLFGAGTVS
jgi:hypothetical protein